MVRHLVGVQKFGELYWQDACILRCAYEDA